MDWKEMINRRVFLKLRDGTVYNGLIIDVDESAKPIIFLTLIDKYQKRVTVVSSEIIKLSEEEVRER